MGWVGAAEVQEGHSLKLGRNIERRGKPKGGKVRYKKTTQGKVCRLLG